jgi:hypothetical protein
VSGALAVGRGVAIAIAVGIVAGVPVAARAQDRPALRRHHVTLSGGLVVGGPFAIGDRAAEIRSNATGAPPPFTLFRAESTFDAMTGVEARLAFAITGALEVEVGGGYAKPQLSVQISQDPESQTFTIADAVSRYVVDVSGVWHVPVAMLGARARPYVIGGAGYLRELPSDRLIVETGRLLQVGAGLRYWIRGGDAMGRSVGVRADVRAVRRSGGIEFEGRDRTYPTVSVLGFAGF